MNTLLDTLADRPAVAQVVLPLGAVERQDAGRVGTKAAHLGDLLRAGFLVPDGFVLTTEVFERAVAEGALGEAPLPDDVMAALRQAVATLGDGPLAVRSSGTAEDLAGASFAGQYETVLDVRGFDAVLGAVQRCWASAFDPRVAAYRGAHAVDAAGGMAVLVQRLVQAEAAGVAFTANPVTGDRGETLVSAVRGLGERLVSGQTAPDEWLVRGDEAICRTAREEAVDAEQVREVAALARRVEAHFGQPQDVEWAISEGKLFLLQARPITALPESVEWKAPLPGAWARHFRLGEWLGDPVTPLFGSWLLTRLDERLYANYRLIAGVPAPHPLHVVVNGWYFCTLNFLPSSPTGMLWLLLRHWLPKMLVQPRRAAMMMPPLAGFGAELFVRDWREALLPRYQRIVREAEGQVDRCAPGELVELINQVADVAGDYFTSITAVTGFAWKSEMPLATFYRKHLQPRLGGSHQRLLCGLSDPSLAEYEHAVQTLDWAAPTAGEQAGGMSNPDLEAAARRARVVADRQATEAQSRAALAARPKLRARFEKLLATAQRFARIRDEQVHYFTLGWPLMRRAILRLGAQLRQADVLAADEDVFFLTREELLAALGASSSPLDRKAAVVERRRAWERQRRLAPPLILGEMSPMVRNMFHGIERTFKPFDGRPEGEGVHGLPASPGRATGPTRVIRAPEEFDRLQPGDVLVAPVTTPAWTPLFARASAVVTDTGSPIAHAALVAREYGIPAVVGTGDATARLRDGQTVTVDGDAGVVELRA